MVGCLNSGHGRRRMHGIGFIFPRQPLVGCGTKLGLQSTQSTRTTSSSPHLEPVLGCGLAAAIDSIFFVEKLNGMG